MKISKRYFDDLRFYSDSTEELINGFLKSLNDLSEEELLKLNQAVRAIKLETQEHKSGKNYYTALILEPIINNLLEHIISYNTSDEDIEK